MLELDDAVLAAARKVALEQYISQKVKELAAEDPKRFACVGEEKFREFIKLSLQKAEKYNMMVDREVNGLRIMMYCLGCGFDEDPMFPWARFYRFPDKDPTMKDQEPESFIHLEKVYARFYRFFYDTNGKKFKYAHEALKRIEKLTFQDVLAIRTDTERLAVMKTVYPHRYNEIPEAALQGPVMEEALKKALLYGFDPVVGKTLFAALIFSCGIAFDTDPLFRVVNESLKKGPSGNMQKEQQLMQRLKSLVQGNIATIEEKYAQGGWA